MKKLLVVLLLVTIMGVSAYALPYINVRISEVFPTQTAPTVAFTAGIEAPLGIAYTSLKGHITYHLDFSSNPIASTWDTGFALQYGSDAAHITLGIDGLSTGTWLPYLEFKISLPLAPFREV